MIISLNELNKRETGKIDLNFSQKLIILVIVITHIHWLHQLI